MSKPLLTGNPADEAALLQLRQRRNRLRAWALLALLLLLVAGLTSALGWQRQRTMARADYYQAWLGGLAEEHYRLTGTTTLVKENERVTEYLDRLYARKAQRDRQPAETVSVSPTGIRAFTFLPGDIGWHQYPFEQLAVQQRAPSLNFTEPAGKPLALWIFSRAEQALAVIFAEIPKIDDLANPALRIIEPVNQYGALTVAGEFKAEQVVLSVVYLLPLAQLRLDTTDGWFGSVAAFDQFVGAVPLLFGIGATSATGQLRLEADLAELKMDAVVPPFFLLLAQAARWVMLPLALLWLSGLLFRLQRARQAWHALLVQAHPHEAAQLRLGFARFLSADLLGLTQQRLAASLAQKQWEAGQQQEALRREQWQSEARRYSTMLEGAVFDEAWLAQASLAELEATAIRLRQQAEQQQAQVDREQQAARERARQLHWLESEFEAIPDAISPDAISIDKRPAVAAAWALYEQARATHDPNKRLELLKSARKLLPKEFKGEQA